MRTKIITPTDANIVSDINNEVIQLGAGLTDSTFQTVESGSNIALTVTTGTFRIAHSNLAKLTAMCAKYCSLHLFADDKEYIFQTIVPTLTTVSNDANYSVVSFTFTKRIKNNIQQVYDANFADDNFPDIFFEEDVFGDIQLR